MHLYTIQLQLKNYEDILQQFDINHENKINLPQNLFLYSTRSCQSIEVSGHSQVTQFRMR